MKKTVAIAASFMILVIAGGVAVIGNLDRAPEPDAGLAGAEGWCCTQGGSRCMANHTPVSCSGRDGIAFSTSEDNCNLACTSFPGR